MNKCYVNIADYQGGNWAFGFVGTIKEWQELALTWCDSDENFDLYDAIKQHELNEKLLDMISEIWTIEIIELNNENINRIMEVYSEEDLGWLLKFLIDKVVQ